MFTALITILLQVQAEQAAVLFAGEPRKQTTLVYRAPLPTQEIWESKVASSHRGLVSRRIVSLTATIAA